MWGVQDTPAAGQPRPSPVFEIRRGATGGDHRTPVLRMRRETRAIMLCVTVDNKRQNKR